MTPALSLLLACALGAEADLAVGVRGEAGYRRVDPAQSPADARAVDLAATPHLSLEVREGATTFDAVYRPRLALRDVGPDRRRDIMHEGDVRLRIEPGPVWRFETFATGSHGRTDLAARNRQDPSQATTVTTTAPLDLQSLTAGLTLRVAPGRRSEMDLAASWNVSGGADARSRASLPISRTGSAAGEYRWRATRLDRISFGAAAQATRLTATDSTGAWAGLLAGWIRNLTPRVEGSARAGAVGLYTSTRDPGSPGTNAVRRHVRPAAAVALTRTGDQTSATASLEGRLGATADRVTGHAVQSLTGSASLGWPAAPWLALRAGGTASTEWSEDGRIQREGASLGASFPMGRFVVLDLSTYASWQRATNPALPSFRELGVTLGLSLEAPPLRL